MSDWKTIDELMIGHAPGSVELVDSSTNRIVPWINDEKYWYGKNKDGQIVTRTAKAPVWQVYTPPPAPKERPQLWWVEDSCGWRLSTVPQIELVLKQLGYNYRPSGIYAPEDDVLIIKKKLSI